MSQKWILFDCMETLVDLEPVPQQKDYAAWAFYPSEINDIWSDFEQFHTLFTEASQHLIKSRPGYEEWSTLDRFKLICSNTSGIELERIETIADTLQKSFFSTYCTKCFVHNDITDIISRLSQTYKLGVVSNFKIENGIRVILEQHNLLRYFEWVLTSAELGWRKPHPDIYRQALKLAGTTANNVLFIGDDPVNDVTTPLTFGMKALLLDRHQRHKSLDHFDRISSLYELKDKLVSF